MSRYAIGVDFGTESGRAILVDIADGRELATAVHPYRNGVIDERLPVVDRSVPLPPDWALQDPDDYLRVFQVDDPRGRCARPRSTRRTSSASGSTSRPARCCRSKADGTPLCRIPELRANPHAWVKLWKHHAAQPEADRINEVARETGQPWLDRYGGKISSEWFFSKALQILDEAPEIYAAADRLIEAADWVVWRLTGVETRNACTAGYKAMWSKRDGFPDDALLRRARSAAWPTSSTTKMTPRHPSHGRAGRRALGRRRRHGPGFGPGPRWPSPTSTPTSRCRRRRSSSRAGWS